ncbi:glycoside hydrolase superfamily [Lipomyces japonicus]|uniref:glycoside hydrolase superfamily n=1 Tax=Lipomyces japonicus TaxID=56871 RepID=UPI0034CF9754
MVRTQFFVFALLTTLSVILSAPTNHPTKRWLNFGYGLGQKVRGVNIGGWLVLEPYINLSFFRQFDSENIPVDEYHFAEVLGSDKASQQLQAHWANWISEDDFAQIAAAGLNHVRIPIGYWAFQKLDGDPYVQGQIPYLKRALEWARQYDLKVWIDLHGAPGSQNGFDNSGLRDSYQWQNDENIAVTEQVISSHIASYTSSQWNDVVVAIQPVNEPLGPILDRNKLQDYYQFSYNELHSNESSNIVLSIHDAFYDTASWNDYFPYPEYTDVILDHHAYQVFSLAENQRNIDAHVQYACTVGDSITQDTLWTVIGEWSAALTDCAEWLNGVYRGSRYDGSYETDRTDGSQVTAVGSCENRWNISTWSDQDKTNSRKYVEAQFDAYEQGLGWIFWCWKTENAVEWDFQRLLAAEIIFQPLTARQFPNQCNNET